MKSLLFIAATAAVLSACATNEPMTAAQADQAAACRRTDAPTGSNLVRKNECAPAATQPNAAAPAETKKN